MRFVFLALSAMIDVLVMQFRFHNVSDISSFTETQLAKMAVADTQINTIFFPDELYQMTF